MAKNNFNYSTTLRLNAAQFKAEIAQVQKTLGAFKNTFVTFASAIGAGVGFSQVIQSVKKASLEITTAKAVLQNVSLEVDKAGRQFNLFGDNMEYCKKIAKNYKQDIVAVTQSFAQFHAACKNTNISLDEQRQIFDSLTRASAYYHMSADQTNNMMMAIVQMMSKGKVTAEELRRQLGNALPGAFNIMAKACGYSTAEFEKLMKAGKIMSEDALPKFAAELKKITGNLEDSGALDSLQLQLNDLKNSFVDLVDVSGFENLYKKIISWTSSLVKFMIKNINTIKGTLIGLFSGTILSKGIQSFTTRFKEYTNSLNAEFKKLEKITSKFNKNSNEKAITDNNKKRFDYLISDKVPSEYKDDYQSQVSKLFKLTEGTRAYNKQLKVCKESFDKMHSHMLQSDEDYRKIVTNLQKALKAEKEHASQMLRMNEIYKQQNGVDLFDEDKLEKFKRQAKGTYRDIGTSVLDVSNKTTLWHKATQRVGFAVRSIGAALKSAAFSTIITAIITLLSTAIAKIIEMGKETKRIADLFKEYEKEVEKAGVTTTEQEAILKNNAKIAADVREKESSRLAALNEINSLMGLEGEAAFTLKSTYNDIVSKVEKWVRLEKARAKISVYSSKLAEYEERKAELQSKISEKAGQRAFNFMELRDLKNWKNEIKKIDDIMVDLNSKIEEQSYIIADIQSDFMPKTTANTEGDETKGETPYEKLVKKVKNELKDYQEALKSLDIQLNKGDINQEKYNEEIDDLSRKTYLAIASLEGYEKALKDIGETDAFGKIEEGYGRAIERDKVEDVVTALNDYKDAKEKLDNQFKNGSLNQTKYNNKLKELKAETYEAITALKDLKSILEKLGKTDALSELEKGFKAVKQDKEDNYSKNKKATPQKGIRSTLFDFRKKDSEKLKEELDITEKYISDLEQSIEYAQNSAEQGIEKASEDLKKLQKDLEEAKQSIPELEVKVKIAAAQEDIEKLQNTITRRTGSGLKSFAQDIDRCISGFKTLKETFEDVDATGWEKFMAIFNELTQVIETLTSVISTFKDIEMLSQEVMAAKAEKNIALKGAEKIATITLEGAEAGETATAVAGAAVKTGAAETETAANLKAAGSGAAASAALIPYPWNIVAIGAGIAAIVAAMAAVSKFADGGIVGGNSRTGDKVLARVNSGEMILNQGQQATLFGMLNGKGTATGGQVDFRIKGQDLVGTLKNYSRYKNS